MKTVSEALHKTCKIDLRNWIPKSR